MKRLSFLLLALAFSSMASAYQTEAFELYSQRGYEPGGFCDSGTRLILDETELQGKVAFMNEFVAGFCELYAYPNNRHYIISTVEDDGCGSMVYKGSRITTNGPVKLEIIDNRFRICDDIVAARVIVKEGSDNNVSVLYSYDK